MRNNWIFLRGWGRDSRHWSNFIELFQEHFQQDRIYLLDVPGSGCNSSMKCPATIAAIVDILNRQWHQQQGEQAVHIVALSFGGMLAIDWMTRYPHVIKSAVLMNISSRDVSPFYQRLNYKIYPEILGMLFKSVSGREQKIIELTSNIYSSRNELTKIWAEYAQQNPVSYGNMMRQLWAAAHYSFPDKKPQQPILLLNSLSDRLVHQDCSKAISELWQLPLNRHPSAGHDMTLDVPLWVIEQLRLWKTSVGKKY